MLHELSIWLSLTHVIHYFKINFPKIQSCSLSRIPGHLFANNKTYHSLLLPIPPPPPPPPSRRFRKSQLLDFTFLQIKLYLALIQPTSDESSSLTARQNFGRTIGSSCRIKALSQETEMNVRQQIKSYIILYHPRKTHTSCHSGDHGGRQDYSVHGDGVYGWEQGIIMAM